MAQSALTVTLANPSPPTNFSFVGNTPPLDPAQAAVDDGTAGSLVVYAAKLAAANTAGAPGAGISYDHEGKGTEVTVTSPGSRTECPTIAFSDGPVMNTQALRDAGPNAAHLSCLTGGAASTLTSVSAGGVSGVGTALLTATGTNFNRASQIYVNGYPQNTTYVSATSLTCNAVKKPTSGNLPVTVSTAGGTPTAPINWVFT